MIRKCVQLVPLLVLALSQSGVQVQLNKFIDTQTSEFVAHAISIKGPFFDDLTMTLRDALVNIVAGILVSGLVMLGSWCFRHRKNEEEADGAVRADETVTMPAELLLRARRLPDSHVT